MCVLIPYEIFMKIQVAESKDWRKKESDENMLCSDRNPIHRNIELSYGGYPYLAARKS